MELTREWIAELFATSRNIREAASRSGVSKRAFELAARNYGLYRKIGKRFGAKIPLQEILEGKHPGYPTQHLSTRLIAEGIKEYKCECCGIVDWNGKPITLQLDHIDGKPMNHLLGNLRLLCPNCHTQTPTYGNRKSIRKSG